ncbi:MAG: alpha/beta fold hydrolase [Gemmataceae bacterium]
MVGNWRVLLERFKPSPYARRQPLVLVNGLSEQCESWFRNHWYWRRYFDVHMPNILVYEGAALHRRIDEGQPIDIDYLVGQLHLYLENFVQTPPYNLVASSLGGKIVVEYAVRYPEKVNRIVLLCPSGMGDEERLPIVEGVRRNDMQALIDSVFCDRRLVDPNIVDYYRRVFTTKRWRTGLLRTIRGTMEHSVRDRLAQLTQPTLLVSGQDDRIVDPAEAETASRQLAQGRFVRIPKCGHAPQMEKPKLINRLVVDFLTSPAPVPRRRLNEMMLAKSVPVPG